MNLINSHKPQIADALFYFAIPLSAILLSIWGFFSLSVNEE
jgi:hypothetical protein